MLEDSTDVPPRRLRILVLTSTFPRWQNDTEPPFVYNLCRSLTNDFTVTVLAPHSPGAAQDELMDGVRVHRFRYFWPEAWQRLAYGGILPNLKRNPLLWAQVPFFLLAEFVAAVRLSRTADVVHAHWLIPQGVVGALLSLVAGKPVVTTAHGADIYGLQGKLPRALKRWALNRTTRLTAVSGDLKNEIECLGLGRPSPIRVISMGVDTDRFHPDRQDTHLRQNLGGEGAVVLFVGRLAEKKGVRYLIEAFPAVLKQNPGARLTIVGDGALREDLEALCRSLSLQDCVLFAGAKRPEELPPYFASADVFVGPSIVAEGGDTDSFGLVFAEAMAAGCAVVASNVGGIRELVRDGETGVLVPQRDATAIADAVTLLLADSRLRRSLSDAGRTFVRDNFDERIIARRYAEVLSEAAA